MGFRVLEMAKISEKIVSHLPTGGLACSNGEGAIARFSSPLAALLLLK